MTSDTKTPKKSTRNSAPTIKQIPLTEAIIPQSVEAEQSGLGALMTQKDTINKATEHQLTADDFFRDSHQKIYQTISDLSEQGKHADLVLLIEELRRRGQLEEVGGPAYLSGLVNSCPISAHVDAYFETIKERSLQRQFLLLADEIKYTIYNEPSEPIVEVGAKVEKKIFEITKFSRRGEFTDMKGVMPDLKRKLKDQHVNRDDPNRKTLGIPTGYVDFDRMTTGLKPGSLILLAARPSMGKTSLALGMAYHMAGVEGKPVAFFSLEMSKEEVVQRLISLRTGINLQHLQLGEYEPDQWEKVEEACDYLSSIPLYIDDTEGMGVGEIRSKARVLTHEHGQLGAIFVDYIGLIHKTGKRENLVQELGEMARSLKGMGGELKVPVICLAQLSRGVESREGKQPELSDLRDSGNLEEHADVVAFIYRKSYYDRSKKDDSHGGYHTEQTEMGLEEGLTASILVRKQRNGPVGEVTLTWLPDTASFGNIGAPRVIPGPSQMPSLGRNKPKTAQDAAIAGAAAVAAKLYGPVDNSDPFADSESFD